MTNVIEKGTKQIPLTKGKVASVDEEYYERLILNKVYLNEEKEKKHTFKNGKGVTTLLHREILSVPKGLMTDHINGNALDNRKSNLRIVSNAQNQANRNLSKNNTSGYKGVGKTKNGTYSANIGVMVDGKSKRLYLGTFLTKEEAAKVYNDAALYYHGCYAKLNVIREE